jgi:hypothetical protein
MIKVKVKSTPRISEINELLELWWDVRQAIDDNSFEQQDVIDHMYMIIFDKIEILMNKAKE